MTSVRQTPSGVILVSALEDELGPGTVSTLKGVDADTVRAQLQAALTWVVQKANSSIVGRLVEAGSDNSQLRLNSQSTPTDLSEAARAAQTLLYTGDRAWYTVSDEYTSRDVTAITQTAGWLEEAQRILTKVPFGATSDEIPRKLEPVLEEVAAWTTALNHGEKSPEMTWVEVTAVSHKVTLTVGDPSDPEINLSW